MTVLLCPGQGAQFAGMGREFAERWPVARETFRRADDALGMPLTKTVFEGTDEDVARTDVCQPAILTCTAAIVAVLEEEGLLDRSAIRLLLGLSLGEYTAHHLAGTLSFEDAVRLVARRGQYMQEASDATPSGMAAVMGLSPERVEEICGEVRAGGGVVVVANLNAPGQVVVSGENGALVQACERLTDAGARRVVELNVAGAFHSPVMQPAADRLAADLAEVEFADPAVPVVSNVTAAEVTDGATARETLERQVVSPVLFERSLRGAMETIGTATVGTGIDFVEPGPGKTLSAFVRKIDRSIKVRTYGEPADLS